MKIEIKHWITGSVLFEGDFPSLADAVVAAVKSRASLVGASLVGARLDRARLDGARLVGASLDRASLENYAQVSFNGHGECGRMLIGFIQAKDESIKFQCGCFSGDEKALREYISSGSPQYMKSRTLALETVLTLLAAKK